MPLQSLLTISALPKASFLVRTITFLIVLGLAGCGGGGGGGGKPSNKPPVASFAAVPSSGPAPLGVTADASQSSDPDGSIVEYNWVFGDGQSATGVRVTHTYAAAGTYEIRLTIRDNQGASSTAASTVSVTPSAPKAEFTATPNAGVAPLLVSFDASASTDADGSIVSYSWNFGDGTTGTGKQVTHTYGSAPTFRSSAYAVVLTVRDNSGLEGTVAQNITVTAPPVIPPNTPPVARITATPANGDAPLSVSFDGSASTDADGTITAYAWAFGDGETATGAKVQHVYRTAGKYTPVLTVTDNGGALSQAATGITVVAPQNQSPIAAFSASPDGGTLPLDVAFDASASRDPDGTIASYTWNFGDGSSAATGRTINHTYSSAGNFVARLTVVDNRGASAEEDQTIRVTAKNTYTVGGTVGGLVGTGLVLQNRGADDLVVSSNGIFTFATALNSGTAYNVTVKTQPSNPTQTCTVTNGSGSVAEANVANVTVTCTTSTYTVGGTVAGLAGTGFMLQNNGTDDLAIASNGTFTFKTPIASGAAYSVTIKMQPTGPIQACTVANASGTVASANVTNVTVTCPPGAYSVGGTVSGLSGTGLVLQNNGADDLSIAANGAFTFATPIASGSVYSVTVKTQPATPTQTCTVANGSGTIAAANVSNVTVTCSVNKYTAGGVVSGLTGTGLVLQNNGADDLAIAANGNFTFSTPIASGATYNVTVKISPSGPAQTCTVSDGSGTVAGANVSNVKVTCSTSYYTVGGTVSGLLGTGLVLQNTGVDDLTIAGDGPFTFGTAIADGEAYLVTVRTPPSSPSQLCEIYNAAGTVNGANVTNLQVRCRAMFAYVANRADGTVSAYAVNVSTGTLTTAGSPVAAGSEPRTVAVHPNNRYVYATNGGVNGGSGRVFTYSINDRTGELSSIGDPLTTAFACDNFVIEPRGIYLYIACSEIDQILAYRINSQTGALTAIDPPVISTGRGPWFIAVDPTGRYIYTSNSRSDNISAYRIDTGTGALTSVGTPVSAGIDPYGIAADPTGRFVYVTNEGDRSISAYTINAATGALTGIDGSGAPSFIYFIATDPDGRFAYVTGLEGGITGYIYSYGVNATTGALTGMGAFTTGGGFAQSIVVDPTGRFLFQPGTPGSDLDYIRTFSINASTGDLARVGETAATGRGQVGIATTH